MLEQRSDHYLLRDLVMGQTLLVEDPHMVVADGLVFDGAKRAAIRTLENSGTNAVYWRVNGVPAAGSFHGVLKACTTQDDGTGGFIDLSRFRGSIYLASVDGAAFRVTAFQALSCEGQS